MNLVDRCHVMIDLETFSSRPSAAIRSIGAVAFKMNGEMDTVMHLGVNVQSCLQFGMHVDGDTIDWWLGQPKENQEKLLKLPMVGIVTALMTLEASAMILPKESMWLWCHGLNFDLPILENAYHAIDRKPWWKYNHVRDTRTLFDIAGYKYEKKASHDALEDAQNQVRAVCEAVKILGVDKIIDVKGV